MNNVNIMYERHSNDNMMDDNHDCKDGLEVTVTPNNILGTPRPSSRNPKLAHMPNLNEERGITADSSQTSIFDQFWILSGLSSGHILMHSVSCGNRLNHDINVTNIVSDNGNGDTANSGTSPFQPF